MVSDWETWMLDFGGDRLFRFYVKDPVMDPQEATWSRRDYVFTYAFIKESIELPDSDILLGFHIIMSSEDLDVEDPPIAYYRLSNIAIEYHPHDIRQFSDYGEEDD